MLAGLFSCFKGGDGPAKCPKVATTEGHRNAVHATSVSKPCPIIPYASNCQGNLKTALGASGPVCQRNWLPEDAVAGSSSVSTPTQDGICSFGNHVIPSTGIGIEAEMHSSCCSDGARSCTLPTTATFTGAGVESALEVRGRAMTPTILLSLRQLHMALAPAMDCGVQQRCSPFVNTDVPSPADVQPSSMVLATGMALGDLSTSESFSMSGLHPQLRFVNACRLGEEVRDLQQLARGGYGMVMTGNWRQEGRVAVKVLASDEDKWMESCYKEAVLSKMLAHPNILQTYDFQVAVLTDADVARAKASWEQHHQARGSQDQLQAGSPPYYDAKLPYVDARADSFELLPPLGSAAGGPSDGSAGTDRVTMSPAAVDLWQALFLLGARPGQFVTLIIMEYAEVGTLQRAIAAGAFRESARLSKWAALRSLLVTAKEVAGGMCLLHSYKIIHGDLSATNVMLRASRIDKRGFVAKVADFGLSKVTLSGVVRTDDWAGQAQYLAPECLDYEARLASDVFAFGVLLYELATGGRAFGEYSPAQILAGRLAGDLTLTWPGDVSPDLRALAERCMREDPEGRPSFREVVEELRRQDAEAKAHHRHQSLSRRYTADGHSAAATAAAGAGGVAAATAGPASRIPSPLGPFRSTVAVTAAAAAAAAAAVNPGCQPRTGVLLPTTAQGMPTATTALSPAAAAISRFGILASSGAGSSSNYMGARGVNSYVHAGSFACNNRSPFRHSFTTGSAGLAVATNAGDSSGGIEMGRTPASSVVAATPRAATTSVLAISAGVSAVSAAEVAAGASAAAPTGDTSSDFTAVGLTNSESSRTLLCCLSEESSGKLCTTDAAPPYGRGKLYGNSSLLAVANGKFAELEPIPSVEGYHQFVTEPVLTAAAAAAAVVAATGGGNDRSAASSTGGAGSRQQAAGSEPGHALTANESKLQAGAVNIL